MQPSAAPDNPTRPPAVPSAGRPPGSPPGAPEDSGSRDERVFAALVLLAIGATVYGLRTLAGTGIGVDTTTVIPALVIHAGETVPAALFMAIATAANLAAGVVLVRFVARRPLPGPAVAVLAGLAGAVLLDVAMLLGLGGLGLFSRPAVIGIHLLVLAGGTIAWRTGRMSPFAEPMERSGSGRAPASILWYLIVLIWAAPFVLQLGSPVVPFSDVLPNHVAPVEHVRTFGSFATLTTSPSPIYGPSRMFLGYVAVLGTLSTLTGLHAVLAEAAFILPLTILVAIAVRRLAATMFGPDAGIWALLTFPLTFTFAQIPDARATVLVVPVAVLALERFTATSRRETGHDSALIAVGLGTALLVHPLIGALCWLIVAIVATTRAPERAGLALWGLLVAGVFAVPQVATMLDFALPSWVGLPAILVGLLALVFPRPLPAVLGWLVPAGIAALVLAALIGARYAFPAAAGSSAEIVARFALLALGAAAAAVLARDAPGWPVVIAAGAIFLLFDVAVSLLPAGSIIAQTLKFEVPKTLRYWLPWFLALAAAGALAVVWRWPWRRRPARFIVLAAVLLAAALPVGPRTLKIESVEERRWSETVSIELRRAAQGFYQNYPDPYELIDPPRQEIVDALRGEETAGRLTAATRVLHVASSFQQWSATPIGVFTGALETTISKDPETSIHTAGGRLHGLTEMPALLSDGFGYVVLEPSDLPSDIRGQIVAAGYRSIFANGRGEVFVRS